MFSTPPSIRSAVNFDGAVILDIEHDAMVNLNVTGGYVWNKLQAGKSVGEIILDLARDTGEEPILIERDVHQFLDQLVEKGLITR
jgi:hypothetical protein